MKDKIEVVAFDADDTLWENELYFQEFEHKFCDLLKAYQPSATVSQELFKTEMKNLHMYGYGLKSMMLSMIETACRITDGTENMHCVEEIIKLGQELLQKPVTLLDGVEDVLLQLQGKYKLVLATTTYNADLYPFMRDYIHRLTERNFQTRKVALIENGSWAPVANKIMKADFEDMKHMTIAKNNVTILSALNEESTAQIDALADELSKGYLPVSAKTQAELDPTALFKIGYGLYVVTCNDGKKDNGLIVNTVTQVSDNPNRIAVNVNKANYSCEVIKNTGRLNVSVLSEDATFKIFEHFGFQSGKNVDKFAGYEHQAKAVNGLPYLTKHANAYISGNVTGMVDLGTHIMFICEVTESVKLSDIETMTYTYYQNNVKPKPETDKKGWVCDICGYIYEGEDLPEDFICPLCKHGAADFSKLE